MTYPSILERNLEAYRIGVANNKHKIFDSTGAKLYPGRWNKKDQALIYCASNYCLAMLEKLVHSNLGEIPTNQQWIKITIPIGTSYEYVTSNSLPNWKTFRISKKFGSDWFKSRRSCILIVPSAIAVEDSNILINQNHPEFPRITTTLNKPVIWDKRLFFLES